MSGVVAGTSGATRASTKADPVAADCLIITPALAHAAELVWYRTRATIVPSPARVW